MQQKWFWSLEWPDEQDVVSADVAALIKKDREDDELRGLADHEKKKIKARQLGQAAAEIEAELDRRVRLTSAADIVPQRTAWLWAGRIPIGEITMIIGKGGAGKSQMLAMFAAWITCGTMKGEYYGTPRNVLYVVNEDSLERTMVPRLMAAGADLNRISFLHVEHMGEPQRLDLTRDLARIAEAAREFNAAAIMFDPLSSNLAVKSNSGDEVRPVMERIRKLAEELNLAVIGLGHVKKGSSKDLLEALMGSSELGNVIRSAMGVMVDTDDEDNAIVLSQEKNNLGRLDIPGYKYRIAPCVLAEPYAHIDISRVEWIGKTDMKVSDMISDADRIGESKTKIKEATDFVRDFLMSNQRGGEAPKKDIVQAARSEGIDARSIDRAGARLKIVSKRSNNFQAGTVWSLPLTHTDGTS